MSTSAGSTSRARSESDRILIFDTTLRDGEQYQAPDPPAGVTKPRHPDPLIWGQDDSTFGQMVGETGFEPAIKEASKRQSRISRHAWRASDVPPGSAPGISEIKKATISGAF
jgi:hypothetical protein